MQHALEQPISRAISGRPVVSPLGLVPARTKLAGRHITLEPLDPALHAAELFRAGHASDEALRIWDYMPTGPWPAEAAFAAWLRTQAAAFDPVWFTLRPVATGTAAGMASYFDIRPLDRVIEIGGIWFAPELQRTRAATEALFLLLAYAMDDLKYRRMQWRCDARNAKSRKAAQRLGFRFEGVFYNHQIIKGSNRDTAWYSILQDEWPEVRTTILAWLDDSTFDVSGNAHRSLSQAMALHQLGSDGRRIANSSACGNG